MQLNRLWPVLACLALSVAWMAFAGYVAFYGWWLEPVVEQDDHKQFSAWATNAIVEQNPGATAFVLIEDGQVVNQWFSPGVDAETLFPTASFSKFIAALSIMSLVEQGRLDLDAAISTYLTRWRLPESQFDNNKVSVRRLLSHTAGLVDGLGFGDYEGDETLPTTLEELSNPRSSSGARAVIVVGQEPGNEFLYSGGGYLILQHLVEAVSGVTYAEWATRAVLEPLQMFRSSFAYLGGHQNISGSYHVDGSPAPLYQYASAAATGFSSSATDLTKLVQALLAEDSSPLSNATLAAMRQPHGYTNGIGIWGLGTILYVQAPQGDFVFGHDGVNSPAINASVRINPATSDAYIMLETGHPTLASDIGSQWVLWQTGYPDILATERALKSAIGPGLAGIIVIVIICFGWMLRRSR